MCTFSFLYADGATVKCEHIVSAAYVQDKKRVTISEDELASCIFPTDRTIGLYSEGRCFAISCSDVRCIEVASE